MEIPRDAIYFDQLARIARMKAAKCGDPLLAIGFESRRSNMSGTRENFEGIKGLCRLRPSDKPARSGTAAISSSPEAPAASAVSGQ